MEDPSILAFQIKSPIKRKSKWFPEGHRNSLIDIWHIDSEKDGTDDSYGWFFPKLSERELKQVDKLAQEELSTQEIFTLMQDKKYFPKYDEFTSVLAIFEIVAWRTYRKHISLKILPEILSMATSPIDNLRHFFSATNLKTQEDIRHTFLIAHKNYRRITRPWYRHPKWHIHHWRIRIPFISQLKRWLFSKCNVCGKGFKWGYSPCASWGNKGPKWFRNEINIWHSKCHHKGQG